MEGSIKKVGDTWQVRYDAGKDPVTGARKQRKKGGFKTKKEAQKFLSEQLNEINKGTYFEPKDITFSEFLDYWLDNHAKLNTAPKTIEGYSYIINLHLKPSLGNIKIAQLNPSHLQQYYTEKLANGRINGEGGLSAQSVKHQHRVISKSLRDAVKWQFLARNVAEAVSPPKVKKVEMQTWDDKQIKTFLEAAKTSVYYSIYLTTIYTGMRRGEVLGLRWQDVDWENKIIYVRQTLQPLRGVGLTFKEPKSGKSRSISITSNIIAELRKINEQQFIYKEQFGSEYHALDLVFAQKNGKPIQSPEMARDYRKVVKSTNLPYIRFHDLRHTHATLLFQQGIHPKVVSERLGHSTIGITMDTYTHVLPNMQKEAADQFEQLLK
ncbi:site-specific integrase [Bacillus massilinigeriensis]|uniref:site-specific integrase n=1 Tax=Bacillus massilionigeriensis TaxID=1805475 RepID=UPI00096B3ECB|nr:site-specific integrase [Bacillus massilionigeriensis]